MDETQVLPEVVVASTDGSNSRQNPERAAELSVECWSGDKGDALAKKSENSVVAGQDEIGKPASLKTMVDKNEELVKNKTIPDVTLEQPKVINPGEKVKLTPELVKTMAEDLQDGTLSEENQEKIAKLFNTVENRKSSHQHNTADVEKLATELTAAMQEKFPGSKLELVHGKTVAAKDGSTKTEHSMKLMLCKDGENTTDSFGIGTDITNPYPTFQKPGKDLAELLGALKPKDTATEAPAEKTQEQKQELIEKALKEVESMTPEQAKEALNKNADALAQALGKIKPETFATVAEAEEAIGKAFEEFMAEHGAELYAEGGKLQPGEEEVPLTEAINAALKKANLPYYASPEVARSFSIGLTAEQSKGREFNLLLEKQGGVQLASVQFGEYDPAGMKRSRK